MQEVHGTSIDQASGSGEIEKEREFQEMPIEPREESGPSIFSKLLTAKTGEGSLESYIEHPLNFNKSSAMSRIIRGATGFIGDLDLAIVDIGFGVLEFVKMKRGAQGGV